MTMDSQSSADYNEQLKQVFNLCDTKGRGYLDRKELLSLCHKLNLDDQANQIADRILGHVNQQHVDFLQFRDIFVQLLCGSPNPDKQRKESDNSEPQSDSDTGIQAEVSPLYVKGKKKYGRKSKPFTTEDFAELSQFDSLDIDKIETDVEEGIASDQSHSLHAINSESGEDGEGQSKKRKKDDEQKESDDQEKEMFEAEGQLNLNMSELENGDTMTEEDYLRNIWKSLGVGKNGYIDITELERVCTHIGMEEMNEEELRQLFEKLDSDCDSRISFEEFLNGLAQHSTPGSLAQTPRSLGTPTPRSLSAQKKIKALASSAEDRLTPSIVAGSGASGLFSTLDLERTGFAKPEQIIDLWENYNIRNGADILLALGFDLDSKVNLSELSFTLEQELVNADEQNAIFQASVSTYQQEIRYLKSSMEQLSWATDKLRQDLTESNSRNALLAKEVDERHATMEKSTENKLMIIEQKYQEQVKNLQTQLEQEREHYTSQDAKTKSQIETQMEGLKTEEKKLRDKLQQAQKEVERLEVELSDSTEKLMDTEKQNLRLQRELESTDTLQKRLEDFERISVMSPEQVQHTRNRADQLETENKELKDRIDELTIEIDHIKHQPSYNKSKSGRSPRSPNSPQSPIDSVSKIPVREGSVLSDYIKPKMRSSVSSENSDDDGTPGYRPRHRRRLPVTPDDDDAGSVSSIQCERENVELKKELHDLRSNIERECKEIEQAYKIEISKIEDKHDQEKAELLKHFNKDRGRIRDEFEYNKLEALAEQQKELQTYFAHEKQDILEKYESEKNFLKQQFEEEKQKLTDRLQDEFSKDLQAQVAKLKEEYEQDKAELEEYLSGPDTAFQELQEEKSELEEKLIHQREELELQFEKEKSALKEEMDVTLTNTELVLRELEKQKAEMQNQFELQQADLKSQFSEEKTLLQQKFQQELNDLKLKHDTKIQEIENSLSQGVSALKGKLKDDFNRLLEEYKSQIKSEQSAELQKKTSKEHTALEDRFESKKNELYIAYQKERDDLIKDYEDKLNNLQEQVSELNDKMEEEREIIARRFEQERETLEEEIAESLREELEDDFMTQMEQIKEAFDAERQELQNQVTLLQTEVDELQVTLDKEQKSRKKLDELNKTVTSLQRDKKLNEKAIDEMRRSYEKTGKDLEKRCEKIQLEKETAINAVKSQMVETSRQSGREKAIYDAIVLEKAALESEVVKLREQVIDLQMSSGLSEKHEETIQKLQSEKIELENLLRKMEVQLEEYKSKSNNSYPKNIIYDLEQDKISLQDKLSQAEKQLLEETKNTEKLSKLQMDYDSVCNERNDLQVKLDELNNKLGNTNNILHKEKDRLVALQLEKNRLEGELQKISNKLMEASSDLAVHQSKHIRELQELKDKNSHSALDVENFTKLQINVVDQQRQLRDLQELIDTKEKEKKAVFKATEAEHKKIIQDLEDEKHKLQQQLKMTQELLDKQLEKLKKHYEECEKRNILVVDLYKENSELMEALYTMEVRKKDAVSRCYKLEDQCKVLRKMLKTVYHVAVT